MLPNNVGSMAPKFKRQRLATQIQEAAAIAGCTGNQAVRLLQQLELDDGLSAQTLIRDRRDVLNNTYGNTNIVWDHL